MTDFRRPDLDLWEEEDAEDGRPTIVSERPTAAPTSKATKASDRTIPFGTGPGGDRKTPEVQRSGLVQRLIEQGALEADLPARSSEEDLPRNSTEELRDSELDLLKLPAEPDDETTVEPTLELVTAARTSAVDTPVSAAPRLFDEVEAEPATEDQVPTVSVKRPLPVAVELKSTASALPGTAPIAFDREVTERISIPTGMVGSIAPATRTFRPEPRERKGLPFWQTALAALVLLGGGISIAKFQSEQRSQTSAVSSQPARNEEIIAPSVSRTAVEPPAPVPAAVAPVPEPVAAPVEQAPSALPPPDAIGPLLEKRDESVVPVSRTRRVRERTALASAEPSESATEEAAPAPVRPALATPAVAESLPSHPTRDQVATSLNAVSGELQKCVGERHGLAEVTVTVRPAGFISYAVVSGEYAGTSEGSCIARAVRTAKFPAFSDPSLRVTYPFQL